VDPTHEKLKNVDPTRTNPTQPMGQPNLWTTLLPVTPDYQFCRENRTDSRQLSRIESIKTMRLVFVAVRVPCCSGIGNAPKNWKTKRATSAESGFIMPFAQGD